MHVLRMCCSKKLELKTEIEIWFLREEIAGFSHPLSILFFLGEGGHVCEGSVSYLTSVRVCGGNASLGNLSSACLFWIHPSTFLPNNDVFFDAPLSTPEDEFRIAEYKFVESKIKDPPLYIGTFVTGNPLNTGLSWVAYLSYTTSLYRVWTNPISVLCIPMWYYMVVWKRSFYDKHYEKYWIYWFKTYCLQFDLIPALK